MCSDAVCHGVLHFEVNIKSSSFAHQLLILVLHLEPGGDAVPKTMMYVISGFEDIIGLHIVGELPVPRVEERPALRVLHQVVDEEADHVDRQEHQGVRHQLK